VLGFTQHINLLAGICFFPWFLLIFRLSYLSRIIKGNYYGKTAFNHLPKIGFLGLFNFHGNITKIFYLNFK